MSEEKPKVDISVVQVVASALAAVSSAVLLSTVGVAGTIIGAAAGSVVATVGSAVYSYSLRASRERVAAAAQAAAMVRVRRMEGGGTRRLSTREVDDAVVETSAGESAREAGGARPHWRESLAALDKKKLALATAAVFLAAMVVIVGFEYVTGKPVSRYTGGTSSSSTARTSVPGLGSHKASATPTKRPSTSPSATPTPSTSPPTSASASNSPTASATSAPATPTPTVTPTTGVAPPPTAATSPAATPPPTSTASPTG